jgi:hypothetical protein
VHFVAAGRVNLNEHRQTIATPHTGTSLPASGHAIPPGARGRDMLGVFVAETVHAGLRSDCKLRRMQVLP